ncbi:HAD hydrolase-like protein [Vibrio sp. M60_M31a]
MKISKSSVWVFDLDDTLCPEREYQLSGYHYIADHLQRLYQRNVLDLMLDADSNGKDVLQEVCLALSLPDSVKQSLLWMYRLHVPTITLDPDIKSAIEMIQSSCTALAIITDGRSISQRNKLLSLGLDAIDTLVSEEWGE